MCVAGCVAIFKWKVICQDLHSLCFSLFPLTTSVVCFAQFHKYEEIPQASDYPKIGATLPTQVGILKNDNVTSTAANPRKLNQKVEWETILL